MPDDAGVVQQPADVARGEPRNAIDIEVGEGLAEVVALAEDGQPAQPGLKALQADLLEVDVLIGRHGAVEILGHAVRVGAEAAGVQLGGAKPYSLERMANPLHER